MSATEGTYEEPAISQIEAPARPRATRASGPAAALQRDPREKSVPLACVLSLMPGLGQVYVGYYQRGFAHSIIVAIFITVLSSERMLILAPLFGMFLAFFWLYNIIDAGRRASLYNQALLGTETIELPRDFSMPRPRGSIGGGLILIAVGSILLSNTRFGYSLDWIEEWWPAAPILLGVYLLIKAVQDRTVTPR